jgi:hypothetical protein
MFETTKQKGIEVKKNPASNHPVPSVRAFFEKFLRGVRHEK